MANELKVYFYLSYAIEGIYSHEFKIMMNSFKMEDFTAKYSMDAISVEIYGENEENNNIYTVKEFVQKIKNDILNCMFTVTITIDEDINEIFNVVINDGFMYKTYSYKNIKPRYSEIKNNKKCMNSYKFFEYLEWKKNIVKSEDFIKFKVYNNASFLNVVSFLLDGEILQICSGQNIYAFDYLEEIEINEYKREIDFLYKVDKYIETNKYIYALPGTELIFFIIKFFIDKGVLTNNKDYRGHFDSLKVFELPYVLIETIKKSDFTLKLELIKNNKNI